MNKQELRFGNWVMNAHGRELQVTNMDSTSKLNPIPLTEEWLVKFDFLNYGGCFYFWEGAGWHLVRLDKVWALNYAGECLPVGILYVNQLQNLYYCLTEEELTIKL